MNSFFAQIVIVTALVVVMVAFPMVAYSACTLWCENGTCAFKSNGANGGDCEGSCEGFLCWCNYTSNLFGEGGCACTPLGI